MSAAFSAPPVLTAAEMARVDAFSINELGLPGAVLMEQAGRRTAEICLEKLRLLNHPKTIVICGRGNNGGDGFVVARHLAEAGFHCDVHLLGELDAVKGDAKLNIEIWQKLGGGVTLFSEETLTAIKSADLVVDAMLGTGAKGALRGNFGEACRAINLSGAHVVSVDLPTGVEGDSGAADNNAVQADETVTFGALKIGLALHPGKARAGKIHVADIGFPRLAFEKIEPQTFTLSKKFIKTILPQRPATYFKNRCGQVFVLAGSVGMSGAAALCSKAALRAGAGLVILGAPNSIVHPDDGMTEIMQFPLDEKNGRVSISAWREIDKKCDWANVVALGPGLGLSEDVRTIVRRTTENFSGLLVIDADGLNALQGQLDVLQNRPGGTILTPHPGEFARLSKLKQETIVRDPIQAARNFAQEHKVHLLLKGAPSVAALPDGRVFINSAGNPGMATAGMGDVLTGVIAGLGGQCDNTENVLLTGMFIHSLAGDLAARKSGEISMTAGDVIENLPSAFLDVQK